MTPERVAALLAETAQLPRGGATELYKTTRFFDSTFQNPSWLG